MYDTYTVWNNQHHIFQHYTPVPTLTLCVYVLVMKWFHFSLTSPVDQHCHPWHKNWNVPEKIYASFITSRLLLPNNKTIAHVNGVTFSSYKFVKKNDMCFHLLFLKNVFYNNVLFHQLQICNLCLMNVALWDCLHCPMNSLCLNHQPNSLHLEVKRSSDMVQVSVKSDKKKLE